MTLTELKYIVAVARERHFGKAADACFVSQSTLSAGLRDLETLLDVVLVERTKRAVRFTPLGNAVVAKAHRLLREAEELAELAEETLTKSDGTGNVAVHTSRFIVEATKHFPPEGIMIRDGGATVIFTWTYNMAKPRDVIWNQNYGHIGTGLPYATGGSNTDGIAQQF